MALSTEHLGPCHVNQNECSGFLDMFSSFASKWDRPPASSFSVPFWFLLVAGSTSFRGNNTNDPRQLNESLRFDWHRSPVRTLGSAVSLGGHFGLRESPSWHMAVTLNFCTQCTQVGHRHIAVSRGPTASIASVRATPFFCSLLAQGRFPFQVNGVVFWFGYCLLSLRGFLTKGNPKSFAGSKSVSWYTQMDPLH